MNVEAKKRKKELKRCITSVHVMRLTPRFSKSPGNESSQLSIHHSFFNNSNDDSTSKKIRQ